MAGVQEQPNQALLQSTVPVKEAAGGRGSVGLFTICP
jgi:hypothetical protein